MFIFFKLRLRDACLLIYLGFKKSFDAVPYKIKVVINIVDALNPIYPLCHIMCQNVNKLILLEAFTSIISHQKAIALIRPLHAFFYERRILFLWSNYNTIYTPKDQDINKIVINVTMVSRS